jgi:hypothetical protein
MTWGVYYQYKNTVLEKEDFFEKNSFFFYSRISFKNPVLLNIQKS